MPSYDSISGVGTPPPASTDSSYEPVIVYQDPELEAPDATAAWPGDGVEEPVSSGNDWSGPLPPKPTEITKPQQVSHETDTYGNLNEAEKAFVRRHPIAAVEFREAAEKALTEAQRMFPDSLHNGEGDAFRHAYWNALMTRAEGAGLAEQFATAHEAGPDNPPDERAMDLYNNAVGREIGVTPDPPGVTLEARVLQALHDGNLQTSPPEIIAEN